MTERVISDEFEFSITNGPVMDRHGHMIE